MGYNEKGLDTSFDTSTYSSIFVFLEVALELGDVHRLENFEEHDRKSLDCIEDTVGRNMVKGSAGEGSE